MHAVARMPSSAPTSKEQMWKMQFKEYIKESKWAEF